MTDHRLAHPPSDDERKASASYIASLSVGNRFRLMFRMPLLPETNKEHVMKTRHQIIKKAKLLRKEITDQFITIFHWNETVRKPDEEKIDTDPGWEMSRIMQGIDMMLQNEKQSLTAKYLTGDGNWLPCVVVPRTDQEPMVFSAVEADGVRHLVPHHDIQF